MLLNYIKTSIRSLLKFKAYAAINLFGLSLGLAAGILILIYVIDELSFDKFHVKANRIYRVETLFFTPESEGITFITIGYQTIRAALADPVESLRYE